MKKKILLLTVLLLVLPLNVFAEENEISIECNDYFLENKSETLCEIVAKNFDFIVTSISGQVKLGSNLKLIESNYDDQNWKMLDDKFDVQDINLMSENKEMKTNFTIAKFKIKATNNNGGQTKIQFVNVTLGDENYEEHNILVDETTIELKYNKQNEIINKNPTTGDINIVLIVIVVIFSVGYSIFFKKNKKEN